MLGSRFLLSVAAFVLGGLVMLSLVSWNVVEPLHPYRLGVLEMVLYFGAALVPAVFWLSVFCRHREFQRRF